MGSYPKNIWIRGTVGNHRAGTPKIDLLFTTA
jgi:hypothetical protein